MREPPRPNPRPGRAHADRARRARARSRDVNDAGIRTQRRRLSVEREAGSGPGAPGSGARAAARSGGATKARTPAEAGHAATTGACAARAHDSAATSEAEAAVTAWGNAVEATYVQQGRPIERYARARRALASSASPRVAHAAHACMAEASMRAPEAHT